MGRWRFDFLEIVSIAVEMVLVKENTCSKEKSDEREDHLVTKVLVEEEHSEHNPEWDEAEQGHSIFDDSEHFSELPDISRELVDEMTRETVGPEAVLTLTEGDL